MMEYNYNECTTKALEEEQVRIAEQYENVTKELNKRRREDEERKKAQLAVDRQKRENEIKAAKKHYDELVQSFIADYGSYNGDFLSWFFRL